MSQTHQLIAALKRALKGRGLTYAQVARHLGLSEASVKRQFSQQRMSLDTLESICGLAEMELTDLLAELAREAPLLSHLSAQQEAELVTSPVLLLVTVCVLNHWRFEDIVASYRLNEAEVIQALLRLDRLGLIRLQPENRVKLLVARDFTWLTDGPIHRFFREQVQDDFLDAQFGGDNEMLRFHHAMLTPAAAQRLKQRLTRVLQEFAELHQDSNDAAVRHGTSLLLAVRSWEPAVFAAMRRPADVP
jgi:transcriptional regulator with XRE-family HTH domain